MQSPFHEGERRAQELAGERSIANQNGAMLSKRISGGMLPFLERQTMVVIGSEDASGLLWCSLAFGPPGFLHSDGTTLTIDLTPEQARLLPDFLEKPGIGVLVIDLSTRRRMRVNGAAKRTGNRLLVTVSEAFPNCAKYITRRQVRGAAQSGPVAATGPEKALGADQIGNILKADVFFVTSRHVERGLDASHRGGAPGFIEMPAAGTLRIPDYQGNSMFNTLGNLLTDPHAALAIPDFARKRVLQLTGEATVKWNTEDPDNLTGGTNRFWTFRVAEWKESSLPEGLHESLLDYSAFNPPVHPPVHASSI